MQNLSLECIRAEAAAMKQRAERFYLAVAQRCGAGADFVVIESPSTDRLAMAAGRKAAGAAGQSAGAT